MNDEFDLLLLGAPAGNGQTNNPDDIAALDGSLRRIRAYTPPPEYAGGPQRYSTGPMIEALEDFQEQNGLKVDGYAQPGGPTERAINNRLLGKPRGANLLFKPPAALAGRVGDGFENRREDVATIQHLLGALGDMPEDPFDEPHGFVDERTLAGVKGFQRKVGLADDGWLAPGGETERALRDAVSDLARANGRDWLRFVERAGRAQARIISPLSGRNGTDVPQDSDTAGVALAAWPGANVAGSRAGSYPPPETPAESDDNARVEPAQTAPGDFIIPFLFLTLPGLLGLGEANRQRVQRQSLGEDEKSGSKTELIPPQVPDEPFYGPNPSKPALDQRLAKPSPYPSQSPHKPEQERLLPPRHDPRDYIEIYPDQSDWIARLPIIVENRQGSPPVKELNRALGKPVIPNAEEIFRGGRITQTGGPTPNESQGYSEHFDPFRGKDAFGFTSNAAGSFKDVSYAIEYKGVRVQLVINTVTVSGLDGRPMTREDRQRAHMALNARDHTFIIDVDKPRANETVDLQAWDRFLQSRMQYIKSLIDKEILTNKDNNQRLLDHFSRKVKD